MPTLEQRPLADCLPEPTISNLDASEIVAASKVFEAVVRALPYYNEVAKASEIKKYAPNALSFLRDSDPDALIVARSGSEIVGFCFSNMDDGLIWLSWFGVGSSHRRVGVGSALLNALNARAKKAGSHKIWCDSRTTNIASAQLLEREGFRQICTLRKHWYGQDFILWERFVG